MNAAHWAVSVAGSVRLPVNTGASARPLLKFTRQVAARPSKGSSTNSASSSQS
ncbi:hypothetical protein SGRIM128S_06992 [Streptomyces griseomycini]